MTNFVGRDFDEVIVNEFVCVGAIRIHAARDQKAKGKLGIECGALNQIAELRRTVMPGSQEWPHRRVESQ